MYSNFQVASSMNTPLFIDFVYSSHISGLVIPVTISVTNVSTLEPNSFLCQSF